MAFDPAKFGAVPVKPFAQGGFDPSKFGAVAATQPEAPSPQPTAEPNGLQKIVGAASDFSTGFVKGGLSTMLGLHKIGSKVLDQTAGRVVNAVKGKGLTPTNTADDPAYAEVAKQYEPKNTAEAAGKFVEQGAEYFIPAGKATKAEKAIDLFTVGMKSKALGAVTRIFGKGAVQGLAAGGVNYAQTGGDKKSAVTTALLGGGTRAGMAVIGEGARALHVPERIYSTIFKNTSKDMIHELKSGGLQKLQETNPAKFDELVKSGIIKTTTGGGVHINETLAEQAIDRGLRGSIKGMADTVVEGTVDAESRVRTIAKVYAGTVDLSEPQFKNVLLKIAAEYEDVGFGEISKEAAALAKEVSKGHGKVTAETGLMVRRLLDKARLASSFDKPATSLSMTQANLKTLADAARGRINAVPGIGDAMKDYSFYIDALEALAKESSRRGNNQVISLIDSVFLGSAFAGANPAASVGLGVMRKALTTPAVSTRLAHGINNRIVSPRTSGLLSGGSAGLTKLLGVQEDQ